MEQLKANTPFRAQLQCIECGETYDLYQVLYRCRKCDGLIDVVHDFQALKQIPAGKWKDTFSDRFRYPGFPYSSGVWGKKEWVLPEIDVEHVVSLGEGATPLIPVPRLAREYGLASLEVKQCGVSHTGSFKDLGMTVLVSHVVSLRARGIPIRAVACASTGDTSAALAAYASAAGIPVIVFLPEGKISTAQLVQPLSSGAIVISLETDFDGCMDIVRSVTTDESIYLANSMNPLRIEGQKTISVELAQQRGWKLPDWIVIPGGNLGNVSALAQGIRLLKENGMIDRVPKICVAQSARANPLYLSFQKGLGELQRVQAEKTLASAIQIGNPVSYPRAVRALKDFQGVVEQATEDELANAAARADLHGLFNDPHTGVALACTEKLVSNGTIQSGESVVVISTAHGLKFSEFKTGYHDGTLHDVKARSGNQPIRLPAREDLVRQAIEDRVGRVS
ncbi:MAG: threonine synthase [Leptospiraceae bacterium]|nr:threonine synthase [Leptospiraceae bacterium]